MDAATEPRCEQRWNGFVCEIRDGWLRKHADRHRWLDWFECSSSKFSLSEADVIAAVSPLLPMNQPSSKNGIQERHSVAQGAGDV